PAGGGEPAEDVAMSVGRSTVPGLSQVVITVVHQDHRVQRASSGGDGAHGHNVVARNGYLIDLVIAAMGDGKLLKLRRLTLREAERGCNHGEIYARVDRLPMHHMVPGRAVPGAEHGSQVGIGILYIDQLALVIRVEHRCHVVGSRTRIVIEVRNGKVSVYEPQ